MSWVAELKKVRRLLRDPTGNVWSEAFLKNLWNETQQDYQKRTHVLEDVVAQRVPQLYHFAYQYDWEYAELPTTVSQFYRCLNTHDEKVFCHRWEVQEITGIDGDVQDWGTHFTQPWEAFSGVTPGDVIKMRYPRGFNGAKFVAYDEEPIVPTSRKEIQSSDPSYVTRQGEPFAYYTHDEIDNSYVLYPRPSVGFANDVEGEGLAFYEEDDTEDDETGTIAVRSGSGETGHIGGSVDIVDTASNVFMVYEVNPVDVGLVSEEIDYPEFLRKYIRYGVISRAYGANTDGRIPSLSDYWQLRYDIGVEVGKRYCRNRRSDRDYRMTTKGAMSRRTRRHPRLPDGYPAI